MRKFMSEQAIKKIFRGVMPLLALVFTQLAFSWAQSLPLDDKARYEKSLEEKVEEVLLKLVGPNQAKVVVQASMDFSRTEKVDMAKGGEEIGENKDEMFKWKTSGTEGQPFNEYLLPGFPAMAADEQKQSYQKQFLFPASFIKKLTVTVVVNKNVSDADAQNVRSVVSEVLGLDAKRGDDIAIIRTPFAPLWRTIWNTPESVALIFKYSLLTLMGILSMSVVAIGFLKLAAAMNTMAKSSQSHQITMDMGKNAAGGVVGSAGEGLAVGVAGNDKEGVGSDKKEKPSQGDAVPDAVFNVRLEQVDFLVNLMSGEDPANISLIAGYLPEEVKTEFLRLLPPDVSSEVVANMSRMRFVDPDVIATIREELEKQLAGAFGGINVVVEALDKVNLKAKREMITRLESRHPDIAVKVRRRIFLPEDLMRFSEKDLGILATAVKIEDWAMALWDFDPEFRDKLKKQLTEKTWAMLEQTMKYGAPSPDKIEKAVETVVAAALKLIGDGRVPNPNKEPADATAGAGTSFVAPFGATSQAVPPPPPAGGKV